MLLPSHLIEHAEDGPKSVQAFEIPSAAEAALKLGGLQRDYGTALSKQRLIQMVPRLPNSCRQGTFWVVQVIFRDVSLDLHRCAGHSKSIVHNPLSTPSIDVAWKANRTDAVTEQELSAYTPDGVCCRAGHAACDGVETCCGGPFLGAARAVTNGYTWGMMALSITVLILVWHERNRAGGYLQTSKENARFIAAAETSRMLLPSWNR